MKIRIRVQPRAKRNYLGPCVTDPATGDEWKLYVTAPALEGKANDACVDFLARALGIARSRVRIVSGEKSRHKMIEIEGIAEAEFLHFAERQADKR